MADLHPRFGLELAKVTPPGRGHKPAAPPRWALSNKTDTFGPKHCLDLAHLEFPVNLYKALTKLENGQSQGQPSNVKKIKFNNKLVNSATNREAAKPFIIWHSSLDVFSLYLFPYP